MTDDLNLDKGPEQQGVHEQSAIGLSTDASTYGVEGEQVDVEDEVVFTGVMRSLIERVVDTRSTTMITRRGKMVALIVPMTVSELVRRKLESDPEFKAQLDAALAEGQKSPLTASDLEA